MDTSRQIPWMHPIRALMLTLVAIASASCRGSGSKIPNAESPQITARDTMAALEIDATKPAEEALDAWQGLLAKQQEGWSPLSRSASIAAIDAMIGHEVFGLEGLGFDVGTAQRATNGAAKVSAALEATLKDTRDAMVRVYAASAMMRLTAAKGDAAGLAKALNETGCAVEATVVGPFVGSALSAYRETGPVDGGTIEPNYAANGNGGAAALALGTSPTRSAGRACQLDITGSSSGGGLRYVVIDIDVPAPQTISVGVETSLPTQLRAGGKVAVDVGYGEIGARTTRFGRVEVGAAGTVRLVAKLAAYSADHLSLYALDEEGKPLRSKAASVGAAPNSDVRSARPDPWRVVQSPSVEARVTEAAGLLAAGDVRRAEALLAEVAQPASAAGAAGNGAKQNRPHPAAALLYARALAGARDLPSHRRLERMRAAYEAVLAEWPTAWEAIIGHAQISALQRRGGAGEVEAISAVRKRRDHPPPLGYTNKLAYVDPLVDAYLALVGDEVYGVREDSLVRVRPRIKNTWLAYRLDRATTKETDDAALRSDCAPNRPDMGRFDCATARATMGDNKGSLTEIARLRSLYHSPKFGVQYENSLTLREFGVAAARKIYDNADLGDRSTSMALAVAGPGKEGVSWLRRQIRLLDGDPRAVADFLSAKRVAGDPSAGADLASTLDGRTRALIAADRSKPARADAGTLILEHTEQYDLESDGFMHAVLWDVRRLGGTIDVDSNASARLPTGAGGSVGYLSQIVQRIFKADGTIVEPDRIAAAQSGAELSQIEPGDYVELVAEGWFAAKSDGALDLDTPDLLPQRTAVIHASIGFSAPAGLEIDSWSHPELGKPAIEANGTGGSKRTSWTLANHDVRRGEKGQTGLDVQVAVRLSSWSWRRLGRDAREGLLAEDERNPEVSAWIAGAVGNDRTPTVDLLVRLAKASKRAIPRVGFLPLSTGSIGGMQNYNARTVLLDAQGSRVALVRRALDELGVKNEVVWAEQGPYSADPKMVARPWRFSHALLIAYVADKVGSEPRPIWLDLDVAGTPPPPGRTSTELRGRSAINTRGDIVPVPANAAEEPDSATIDLVVDETGRARGTFALLLRGPDAQDIASVLEEEAGEDRQEALQGYVLAWMPDADVIDVKASAETWQVIVTAKVEVPSILVPDGNRLAVSGMPPLHEGRAGTLGATYAAQAKRTTALVIRDAVQYTVHRIVRLPKGTAISTPLPSVEVIDKSIALRATRKVKVDGTTLIDDVAFSLPTGVIQTKDFEAFTATARAVDDGFGAVIRIQPQPGAIKLPTVAAKPSAAKGVTPKDEKANR